MAEVDRLVAEVFADGDIDNTSIKDPLESLLDDALEEFEKESLKTVLGDDAPTVERNNKHESGDVIATFEALPAGAPPSKGVSAVERQRREPRARGADAAARARERLMRAQKRLESKRSRKPRAHRIFEMAPNEAYTLRNQLVELAEAAERPSNDEALLELNALSVEVSQARSVVESLEQRRAALLNRLADVERANRLRPRSAEAGGLSRAVEQRSPRPSALMAAVSSDVNVRFATNDAFTHQTRAELESLTSALTEANSVLCTLHEQRTSLLARQSYNRDCGEIPPPPPQLPVLAASSVDSSGIEPSARASSPHVPSASTAFVPKLITEEQTRATPAVVPSLHLAELTPLPLFAGASIDGGVATAPSTIASSDEQAHYTGPSGSSISMFGKLSQALFSSNRLPAATPPLVAAKEASMARVREKKAALLVRKVNQPKVEDHTNARGTAVVDAARVQGGAISLAAKAMNQDHHSSRKKTPHSVFQALGMAQEPIADDAKEGEEAKSALRLRYGEASDSVANDAESYTGSSDNAFAPPEEAKDDKSVDWFQLASHLSSVPADVLAARQRADVAAQSRKELRRKRRAAEKWKVRFADEVDGGDGRKSSDCGIANEEAVPREDFTSEKVPSWSPDDAQPLLLAEDSAASSGDGRRQPPRPVGCDLQVLWQNTLPTEGLPLGHEDHDRDDPSSDALSAEVTQEEQAFNTFSEVSPTEGLHLLTAALMQGSEGLKGLKEFAITSHAFVRYWGPRLKSGDFSKERSFRGDNPDAHELVVLLCCALRDAHVSYLAPLLSVLGLFATHPAHRRTVLLDGAVKVVVQRLRQYRGRYRSIEVTASTLLTELLWPPSSESLSSGVGY